MMKLFKEKKFQDCVVMMDDGFLVFVLVSGKRKSEKK